MLNTNQKLKKLRHIFPKYNIDCYLVSHTDEFQNEFLPNYSKRLQWISDFSGSAGEIIITKNKAFLFVDGRYTIQSEREVSKKDFSIYNYKDSSLSKILKSLEGKSIRVGFDSNILTIGKLQKLKKQCGEKIDFIPIERNLIDKLWINKPKKAKSKPFLHEKKFSGENSDNKIKQVIKHIKQNNADRYLLTSCDSICWLFNIRAKDITYSPLFLSKAIIESNGTSIIFSDYQSSSIKQFGQKVQFKKLTNLKNYIENKKNIQLKYICHPESISVQLYELIFKFGKVLFKDELIQHLKARKNKTEIKGMKNSHIRDGATLTKFIYWIKKNISNQKVTELDAIKYLDNERRKNKNFFSLSFPTIAGSGPNGAIVHYHASKKSNRTIKKDDLLLVDSGAQYFDGTTDVTRTIAFSCVSEEQKEMYTRVLKGHIAVAQSQIGNKENGKKLDKTARKFLLEVNKNFDHSTGHGVGSFLNVHEGPQSISAFGTIPFKQGMIVSNEPGFYKKNQYGIRIENLILAKMNKGKLAFQTITLAPLEKKLIKESFLTKSEIRWINNYHSEVKKKLLPCMNKNQAEWLKEETARIIH